MKPIVTALGICAVFLVPVAALATSYTWDGSSSSAWDNGENWVESGWPDEFGGCADSASITVATSNPVALPALDICITSFTMSKDTSLNVNTRTLSVDGTATFSDPSTLHVGTSDISISGGTADPDGIIAETMVFSGGADGVVVTVTGTTKLQTAAVP